MRSAKSSHFRPKIVNPLDTSRWHTKMGNHSSQLEHHGDTTTPTRKLGTIFSSQTPFTSQPSREASDPKPRGPDAVDGKGGKRKRDSTTLANDETPVETIEPKSEENPEERTKRRRRDSSVSILGQIRVTPIKSTKHRGPSKAQPASPKLGSPTASDAPVAASFDVDGFGVAEDHRATARHPLDDVPSEDEAIAATLREYRATSAGREIPRRATSGSSEQRFATPMTAGEASAELSEPQLPPIRPQARESEGTRPRGPTATTASRLAKPGGQKNQNSIDMTAQDIVATLPAKGKKRKLADTATPNVPEGGAMAPVQGTLLGVHVEKSPPPALSRLNNGFTATGKPPGLDNGTAPKSKRQQRSSTFDHVRNSLWVPSAAEKGKAKAIEQVAARKPDVPKHGKGKEKLECREREVEPANPPGPFESSKFMARIREEQDRENAMRSFAEAAYAATQLPKRASRDAASKRISDLATLEAQVLAERANFAKAQRRQARKSEPSSVMSRPGLLDLDYAPPSASMVQNEHSTETNGAFTTVKERPLASSIRPANPPTGGLIDGNGQQGSSSDQNSSTSPPGSRVAPLAPIPAEQPSKGSGSISKKKAKAELARAKAERYNAEKEKRRSWLMQVKAQRSESQDPPGPSNDVASKPQPEPKPKDQARKSLLSSELRDPPRPPTSVVATSQPALRPKDQKQRTLTSKAHPGKTPAIVPEKPPLVPIFSKNVASTGRQLTHDNDSSDSSDTEEELDRTDVKLPTEDHGKSTTKPPATTVTVSAALPSNTEDDTSSSGTDDTESTDETEHQSSDEAANAESPAKNGGRTNLQSPPTLAKSVDVAVEESSSSGTEESSEETDESDTTNTASTSNNFVDELAEPSRQTLSNTKKDSMPARLDMSQRPTPLIKNTTTPPVSASAKRQAARAQSFAPSDEQSEESDEESDEVFRLEPVNKQASAVIDDQASAHGKTDADASDSDDVMRSPDSSEDELASTPARKVPRSAPSSLKSKPLVARATRRKSAPAPKAAARADTPSSTTTRKGVNPRSRLSDEDYERLEAFKRRHCTEYHLDDRGFAEKIQQDVKFNKKNSKLWDRAMVAVGWPEIERPKLMKAVRRIYHNYHRAVWTTAEDERLAALRVQIGPQWRKIATILDRMPEDVRDRFRNHVKDGDKRAEQRWSAAEEDALRRALDEAAARSVAARCKEHGRESWRDWAPGLSDLVVWGVVSEDMGKTRSRAQCRAKAKLMIKRGTLDVGVLVQEGLGRLRRGQVSGKSGQGANAGGAGGSGSEPGDAGDDADDGEYGRGKPNARKRSRQSEGSKRPAKRNRRSLTN